jgi:lipopolysaccharide export system permease protein
MKTLDRYIRGYLIQGFIVVLVVLVSVFSFLDFAEELDDIAVGNYNAIDVLSFVLLTVPERALWLVPVSALLGSLLALSLLDHHNELTVMRSAGISSRRIMWSVVKTAIGLIVVVIIFAQFISPVLGERAWRDRALAIAGDVVLRKDSGTNFWFRDGRRFISIRDMVYGRIPSEIEIYEFDEQGELTIFTEAQEARAGKGGTWQLLDVVRKRYRGFDVELEILPTLEWEAFLSPVQGAVIQLDAQSLAPSDLYSYARDLRARGQSAERYELALWRKLNIPIATLAMVLIALPFVFGSRERSGIGQRVLFGAGVGVVFYLVDQVLAQLGLLAHLNPAITTSAPAVSLLMIALFLLRRVS